MAHWLCGIVRCMTNAPCVTHEQCDVKFCSTCNEWKLTCEFSPQKLASGNMGLRSKCKPCYAQYAREKMNSSPELIQANRERSKKWKSENPQWIMQNRASRFARQYNLSLDQYWSMLSGQNASCKICGTTEPGKGREFFTIDHDHSCCPGGSSCGSCIRGLLCANCNTVLGAVGDDVTVLQNMIEYLRGGAN